MKKTILAILLATIIGFTFGFFFLKKLNTETITEVSNIKSQVYAFQIGVYKNKDNALKEASTNNGIVILDNDIYRVYTAILKDATLIDNLKNYYNSIGLNYYLKAINVSSKTSGIIDNYESLLKSCDSSNYNLILDSMLKEIDSSDLWKNKKSLKFTDGFTANFQWNKSACVNKATIKDSNFNFYYPYDMDS